LLDDEEQINVLKDQLLKTSIIIEDGEYQVAIDSIDKLNELIKELRKLFVVA
jgi:hypothetical protein